VDSSGTVRYYWGDHLGTTRIVTDAAGNVCYDADFYPFQGERAPYVSNCTPAYKFAGMKFDQESGDYYTLNRYYPPNLGRWLTPDPVAGDISNPQSLNRYAYVLNNPTNFIDPLGLDDNCYWIGTSWECGFTISTTSSEPYAPAFPLWTKQAAYSCLFDPWGSVCQSLTGHGTPGRGGGGGTPTIGPAAEPVKPPPPQPDTRPYCADIFSDALLGGLLGSGASTYAKGEAAEQALQAGSQAYAAKALEHQIERRLVVPLRSSIVRRLFLGARALGFVAEMVPWGVAAYEILPAEYQSVKAAVKGECRGVF